MNLPFSKREVAVVLTGAEWVAVLGLLLRQPLSEKGVRTCEAAADKLNRQLLKAQGAKV